MHQAWRPLHRSSLDIVFVMTLVALLVASAFFVRGVIDLLSVEGVQAPWQALGLR